MKARYVYVASRPDGAHKIGVSGNPKVRRTALGAGTLIVRTFRCDEESGRIESLAHDLLEDHEIGGEWFSVGASEAIKAVKKAMIRAHEDPRASGSRRSTLWVATHSTRYRSGPIPTMQEVLQQFIDDWGLEETERVARELSAKLEAQLAQRRSEDADR